MWSPVVHTRVRRAPAPQIRVTAAQAAPGVCPFPHSRTLRVARGGRRRQGRRASGIRALEAIAATAAYGLRLTAYGLRLTAYGLRLTAYEKMYKIATVD